MNFGFEYNYDLSPMKYNLAQLAYENNEFVFEPSTIDTDITTTKYLAKLYVTRKIYCDMIPSIGFGKIKIKTKDNTTNTSKTTQENIISLGIEKRF
ncbi:MAG: hypothetical protein U9O56_04670 [Campylobacterota bacterium]|nr:hypothetical protein [Campylobacterota bacterium]